MSDFALYPTHVTGIRGELRHVEFPLGYISGEATLEANEILPLSRFENGVEIFEH